MDDNSLAHRQSLLQEFRYLPMFYLIPEEYLAKRKLDKHPRDPMTFAVDPYWKAEYYSEYFQVQLMDMWAWMMWQSFGIRGGFDSYSTNDPFVQLAVNLPVWTTIAVELGMTTNLLATMSVTRPLPFPSVKETAHNCGIIFKRLWDLPNLKLPQILEIIEEHRAHDDYSMRYSNIKIDFYRSYYHTRNKWSKIVPLEQETDDAVDYGHTPNEFVELEHRMWVDSLCEKLNDRDTKILKLLDQGYTQQEIADILGYANHSGVNKRIKKHIAPALLKYKQEDSKYMNRP